MKTVSLTTVFLIWAVPAFSTRVKEEPPSAAFTVVSYNIRYGTAEDGENSWEYRKPIVFESLRVVSPGLVGLQEALQFQIAEILEVLPQFRLIGVGRDDGNIEGEYSAILYDSRRFKLLDSSTFWYSDTPRVPGSRNWGNTIPRICTWARLVDTQTDSPFYLFNTHFDHRSQTSREKSAQALIEAIRTRRHFDPVIVTGDFNAGEDNRVIQYLKGESPLTIRGELEIKSLPLIDTFRAIHPEAAQVGTFNGFKGIQDGAKIDFVFVTSGVEVLSAEIDRFSIDGHFPSDHFPVTATIVLNRME